jgi:hypothetical protein
VPEDIIIKAFETSYLLISAAQIPEYGDPEITCIKICPLAIGRKGFSTKRFTIRLSSWHSLYDVCREEVNQKLSEWCGEQGPKIKLKSFQAAS